MGILKQVLDGGIVVLKRSVRLAGGRRADAIAARIAEELVPVVEIPTRSGPIRFYCPGPLTEFRARTLLTKEPETIRWIETFQPGEVLWDIGANVGVYSLYAASRGVTVQAFEPSAGNYYLLNRNININGFDERVSAFCLAFADKTRLASFHLQTTELGGALNAFGEPRDWQGAVFTPASRQSMIGFGIDDFMRRFDPPFPNHIKIDVDGVEDLIVAGASGTLADPRVKSVQIELTVDRPGYPDRVIESFGSAGLHVVARAHPPESGASTFNTGYNYLFARRHA